MTVKENLEEMADFFMDCMKIMEEKNPDYNPTGLAYEEVEAIAKELEITPEKVLWIYLRKHLSAINGAVKGNVLKSEKLLSRCHDAANYIGMIAVLLTDERAGQ